MNYAQIRKFDVSNGPGVRTSLFVSGCTHDCAGCFNRQYKDFTYGSRWSKEVEDDFFEHLKNPNLRGVTILGGEPLDQIHDNDLLRLLQRINQETRLNVWLYSGYTYEEILLHPLRRALIEWVDVLVDGRFEIKQKDLRLRFRGSSNQRIIDIQASLHGDELIELAI